MLVPVGEGDLDFRELTLLTFCLHVFIYKGLFPCMLGISLVEIQPLIPCGDYDLDLWHKCTNLLKHSVTLLNYGMNVMLDINLDPPHRLTVDKRSFRDNLVFLKGG